MALIAQAALLRAVNVGGRKLAMADLMRIAVDLGLQAPRTLLQSGNLVFASEASGAELEERLQEALASRLGLVAEVMTRTAGDWTRILAANPHRTMAERDPAHLVVMALKSPPDATAVEALKRGHAGPEAIEARGRELYVTYPAGIGESRLKAAVLERRLGVAATGRNWNTMLRIADLLAAAEAEARNTGR